MPRIPLLDLGNVVVKVDFHPFLTWLAARSEEKDFAKASRVLTSSLFYDFEFGALSPAAFTARLGNLYRAEFREDELTEQFCAIFPGLVEGMEALVAEMAAAGPLYCLTNTNELHLSFIRRHFPVMEKFTKVFASHELHKRKPYPGIYLDVANALDVAPADLVFFDDVPANVQGAARAGLEAHLFTSAVEAEKLWRQAP